MKNPSLALSYVYSALIVIAVSLSMPVQAQNLDAKQMALKVAREKGLAQKRQWQKLLHFEPQMFGTWTYSQIDSTNFFISSRGFVDREAELIADIEAMWDAPNSPEERLPQCVFPARYQFLKKNLAPEITNFPDRECPRFQKYLTALKGSSVSLVFSSFYLNNPSSAFGHTFLRINKEPAKDGKRYELLDYGINYAAEADTSNALFYAVKGLFGMFPGKFTSVPYYYKVREYNNSEARDLWEYELNVNSETVSMLIAHIWELGPAYIDYWYLTENCSYHMLTALEAADPTIDVVSRVKKWVIPSDTVKDAWNTPGLVKSFHYRPAVRTEFFSRLRKISSDDQIYLKKMIDQFQIPEDFSKRSEANRRDILDAAIDYMDFKFVHQTQKPGPETDFKNKILNARSQVSLATEPLIIPAPEREMPHLAHGSRRLGLGYRGSQFGDDAVNFGLKHALHDRVDLITGYPEYAAISFGDFQFSYSRQRQKVELEDFSLFEVISYSPYSMFNSNYSWRVKLGAEKIKDENCIGCHAATFSGGAGYTFAFNEEPMITWFLGIRGATNYIYHTSGNHFINGAGPSTELRFRWKDNFITTLEGWYRRNLEGDRRDFQQVDLTTQYSFNKDWAVQVLAEDVRYDRSVQGQVLYFY